MTKKILQDIWIISDAGTVLFKRLYEEIISSQLFGGLMSALNAYAHEISNDNLKSLQLQNKKFVIIKKNNFLFISSSSKGVNTERINSQLNEVSKKFFELYPIEWFKNEWTYDLAAFKDFEKKIDDLLDKPITKFWGGLIES